MKAITRNVAIVILFLHVVVDASQDLEEKQEQKCPSMPNIKVNHSSVIAETVTQLVTPLDNESGMEYSAIFFPSVNGSEVVEITCRCSMPIDFEIESQMPVKVQRPQMTRTVCDYGNNSTYCFSITFHLKLEYSATGHYICHEIASKDVSSSVILFINEMNRPALLNVKEHQKIEIDGLPKDDGVIVIPCITTDPKHVPTLHLKDFSGSSQDAVKDKHYNEYLPGTGFAVLVSQDVEISPIYFCRLKNESLEIRLRNYGVGQAGANSYFRVSPKENLVQVQKAMPMSTLICESNSKIKFSFGGGKSNRDYNVRQKGLILKEYRKGAGNFYRYKIELIGNMESMIINCESSNGADLHSWNVTSESRMPEITYNDSDGRFRCQTAKTLQPTISLITCENLMNCKMAKKFAYLIGQGDYYPFTVTVGFLCNPASKGGNKEAERGCAIIPKQIGHKIGLAMCQVDVGDQDKRPIFHFLNYFTGFGESIVTHLNVTEITHKLLKLHEVRMPLYVDERVTFTCEASGFVFSSGIEFFVHFNNGTVQAIKKCRGYNSSNESIGTGLIISNATVQLLSSDISRIECSAPLWNTLSWWNDSRPLNLSDGTCITITRSSPGSVVLKTGEENRSLWCEALGDPEPTIEWEKDEKGLSGLIGTGTVEIREVMNRSILQFLEVKEFHEGTYKCIARNAKGDSVKAFIVVVEKGESYLLFGVTGGLCALIILIVAIAFYFVRKQRKVFVEKLTEKEIEEFHNGNQELIQKYTDLQDNARYLPYKHDFEIPKNKLEICQDELLGSGISGFVNKGYYLKHDQKVPVAVKTGRSQDIGTLKVLLSEIKILMYIGSHTNVISLLGAMTNELKDGKLLAVVEFCGFGNVQEFLRDHRGTFLNQVEDDMINFNVQRKDSSFKAISWNIDDFTQPLEMGVPTTSFSNQNSRHSVIVRTFDLLKWSYQVASGMQYLGEKKVIHADLALRNLLLTEALEIKITDFGLSRHLYDYTNYVKKQKEDLLPWRWLALEAIGDAKFSIETDIWAFGVTLWEFYTLAESPYPGFSWGVEFVQKLSQGYRLPQPKYATSSIYNLMRQCWVEEPSKRPKFSTLKNYFQGLLPGETSRNILSP